MKGSKNKIKIGLVQLRQIRSRFLLLIELRKFSKLLFCLRKDKLSEALKSAE